MPLAKSLKPWLSLLRDKHSWPLILIAGLIVGYALLGFKIIPYALKAKLPEFISAQTHSPAAIQDIHFNPFTLNLKVNGFELKDQKQQPFFSLAELFIDINVRASLKSLGLVVEQIRLQNPEIAITALKNGDFNFSDLASKDEKPKSETSPSKIPLLLKQLHLVEGKLNWRDERLAQPETETLSGITLSLDNLSTVAESVTKLSLSSAIAGDGQMADQMDLALGQQTVQGTLHLKKIPLPRLWALLLKDRVNYKIPQGETDLSLHYQINYKEGLQLQIRDGSLINRNVQITALEDAQPVISIPELNINDVNFDLAKQDLQIGRIETKQLELKAWLNPAGELNYQSLFAAKTEVDNKMASSAAAANAKDTAKPWQVNIADIALQQGKILFTDQNPVKPYKVTLADLSLNLSHYQLHYQPQNLQMQLEASRLQAHDINLAGFKLQANTPPLQVQMAELNIGLDQYQLTKTEQMQMTVHDGRLGVQKLQFSEQGAEKNLVAIADVNLQGADLDLARQQLAIKSLQSGNAQLRAWLDKKGQLNYQTLLASANTAHSPKVKQTAQSVQAKKTSAPGWKISLAELWLKNYQLDLQDNSKSKPVTVVLAPLDLRLQQLSNQPGAKLPFSLKSRINKKGSINITGSAVLEPLQTEAQLNFNALALANFHPYLNDFMRIDVIDGALNTALKVKLSKADSTSDLQLHAQGTANVQNLVTRDQILNKDLIKWRSVKLDAIDFALTPLNLNIGNILLQEPYARVTIKKDRTLNFEDIIIQQPPAKVAEVKPVDVNNTVKPRYNIKAVTISNGSSDFSDFSLILPFVVQLNDLNGAIKSIASEQKNFTDFNLAGKVFDLSPMDVQGKFKPDMSNLDIAMHFKGMPLPFISPYMVEFAGYKIEKGKMSLDLLYKVAEHKLTAENNMVLEQLTLGEKVENPKATSLPLSLAIALLKDSNGKIIINMPIQGSLDDPEFSIGPLLWDAFVNVITRVVTSPFNALGSLMSNDADMSKVSFQEGSDVLGKEQLAQLEQIAKGLAQKIELSVEVKGIAYEKQDWPAMQDEALIDQLKTMKAAELNASGQRKLAEYVELSADETQRLRADLFLKKFPHLAKRSLLGKPELIAADKDFDSVAKQELAAIIPPDRQKLSALADSRARNIAQYLIQKGSIAHERIYILQSEAKTDTAPGELVSELALKVE